MLRAVPENVLLAALMESDHRRIVRIPTDGVDLDSTQTCGLLAPEKSAETRHEELIDARFEKLIDARFNRFTTTHLTSVIEDLFPSIVDARLKMLVDAGLPEYTKDALESAMSYYQEQFDTECQRAECEIQEKVDDASLDVKMELERGVREIEELVHEHLQQMAEEWEAFDEKAESKVEYLKQCFVKLAQKFFRKRERLYGRAETAVTRRRSI